MPLDNTAADLVVEQILVDLGLSPDQAALARPKWQVVVRRIYTGIPVYATTVGTATAVQPGVGTAPVTGLIV